MRKRYEIFLNIVKAHMSINKFWEMLDELNSPYARGLLRQFLKNSGGSTLSILLRREADEFLIQFGKDGVAMTRILRELADHHELSLEVKYQ